MLPNLFTAYNLLQAFVQLERKYEAVNMKQKQKINKKITLWIEHMLKL